MDFKTILEDFGPEVMGEPQDHREKAIAWLIAEVKAADDRQMRLAKWFLSGDTGASSETIVAVMMGLKAPHFSAPYDSSDFGRCRRLIERFPEWAPRLNELASVDRNWAGIVEKWDVLFDLSKRKKDIEVSDWLRSIRHEIQHGTRDRLRSIRHEIQHDTQVQPKSEPLRNDIAD